jgi:hypothetical protein
MRPAPLATPAPRAASAEARPRTPARARLLVRLGLLVLGTVAVTLLAVAYPALARGRELMSASWREPWYLLGLLLVPVVFWRGTFGEDRRTPRLLLVPYRRWWQVRRAGAFGSGTRLAWCGPSRSGCLSWPWPAPSTP